MELKTLNDQLCHNARSANERKAENISNQLFETIKERAIEESKRGRYSVKLTDKELPKLCELTFDKGARETRSMVIQMLTDRFAKENVTFKECNAQDTYGSPFFELSWQNV